MIEPPDTEPFDSWVSRWKGAYRYQVFVDVRDDFDGARIGTPAFQRKVSQWIRFWWAHAQERGLRAGQLALLLWDEPRTSEQEARVVAWASVIKKAVPDVWIWEDPDWKDPRLISPPFFDLCDVLCTQWVFWLRGGSLFSQTYLTLRTKGKRLGTYSTSGPSARMDPYGYYRLQAWHAFAINAEEMQFWSFADNGGSSPWHPYIVPRISYSPLFISPESVTPTKHMEAIREGIEDHETLSMLRSEVTRQRNEGSGSDPLLAEAQRLLSRGVEAVLASAGGTAFEWGERHDRTAADETRAATLRLLDSLVARSRAPRGAISASSTHEAR
jgi:hypothetical protein